MSAPSGRMRTADLLGMALSPLRRQKARTALTVIGVAIGTFALVASLAVGRGVDRAILSLFRGTDALRQVALYVRYETAAEDVPEADKAVSGAMSDAKRERLRHARVRSWEHSTATRPKVRLDRQGLVRLEALPHVVRVVPIVENHGTAKIQGMGDPRDAQFASADADGDYRHRLVAGRVLSGDHAREAVVHEYLLYKAGLVGDDVREVLGRTVTLEYRMRREGEFSLAQLLTFGPKGFRPEEGEALVRALKRIAPLARLLPIPAEERSAFVKLLGRTPVATKPADEEVYTEDFTVVGVVRESLDEDDKRVNPLFGFRGRTADVLLPAGSAAEFTLKSPFLSEVGLNNAALTVDRDANVKGVASAVEAMGFSQSSLIQVIETIRLNILMITLATAFIAAVALSVSAIGITNTMVMSVLERTHEIGIMKALGARTGQVRAIFLVEGAAIGLVGGALGQLLAWLLSFPGDRVAKSIMNAQTPRPIEGSLFAFPLWLVLGAPALAAIIATLAAAYPAHRAASVDPMTSLRHE